MSASAKKITPLELYVKAFLREHKKISRGFGVTHLEDALTLIHKKLGLVCCDNPPTPVTLHNRPILHNQFVDTVRQLLKNMIKRGNVKSLLRTRDFILLYLAGCCESTELTVMFDTTAFLSGGNPIFPKDALVKFYDTTNGSLIYETSVSDPISKTVHVPIKYFLPDALVKICLHPISHITSPFEDGLWLPDTTVILEATSIGFDTCTVSFGPLSPVYVVVQDTGGG